MPSLFRKIEPRKSTFTPRRPLAVEPLEAKLLLSTSPVLVPGDANGDFQFNQLDILQVLQSGKYLTEEPATFEEGDWNRDGVFGPDDIVLALQENTYIPQTNAAGEGEISEAELVKEILALQLDRFGNADFTAALADLGLGPTEAQVVIDVRDSSAVGKGNTIEAPGHTGSASGTYDPAVTLAITVTNEGDCNVKLEMKNALNKIVGSGEVAPGPASSMTVRSDNVKSFAITCLATEGAPTPATCKFTYSFGN